MNPKEYLVHKVIAEKDTLFKLSLQYNISKKLIQSTNEFEGEDIFFMKEILIPFFNQKMKLIEPLKD